MWSLVWFVLIVPALVSGQQIKYDHYNDLYFTGNGSLPNLYQANGLGAQSSFGLPLPQTPPSVTPSPEENGLGSKTSVMQPPSQENGDGGAGVTKTQTAGTTAGSVVESEEDLLALLIASGAITGVQSLPGSGAEEIDFAQYASGGFRIVVDGKKVRDAFGRAVDVNDILKLWKSGKERQTRGKNLTTGQYYALIAATLAEEDGGLDRAEFTEAMFEITYRSRGGLLWVIPWSFPVRVTITMNAPEGSRVVVKFPWYHWFVREYFTRTSLAQEIEGVITAEKAHAEDSSEAMQIRLFVSITQFLRQKVRTVSDSILLGS